VVEEAIRKFVITSADYREIIQEAKKEKEIDDGKQELFSNLKKVKLTQKGSRIPGV
jgi:hypothetical protein